MARFALKRAAIIRTGFEYQDLNGIELLIAFYRDPSLYNWVQIESEDPSAGYIDDVVAERKDGSYEYFQVKFTPDPDKYFLTWEYLLERKPRGTSRLKKWWQSLTDKVPTGKVHRAELRTNRRADKEFGDALLDGKVKLETLSPERKAEVIAELGTEDDASKFFRTFRFALHQAVDHCLQEPVEGSRNPNELHGLSDRRQELAEVAPKVMSLYTRIHELGCVMNGEDRKNGSMMQGRFSIEDSQIYWCRTYVESDHWG